MGSSAVAAGEGCFRIEKIVPTPPHTSRFEEPSSGSNSTQ